MSRLPIEYLPLFLTPLLGVGFLLLCGKSSSSKTAAHYISFGMLAWIILEILYKSMPPMVYSQWAWRVFSVENVVIVGCALSLVWNQLEERHVRLCLATIVLSIPILSCITVETAAILYTKPLIALDLTNVSLAFILTLASLKLADKPTAMGFVLLCGVRILVDCYRLHSLWAHWEIVHRIVPFAEMITHGVWFTAALASRRATTQKVFKLPKRSTGMSAVRAVQPIALRARNGKL